MQEYVMQTTRDRKVWSVHSLHRPYENAEPAHGYPELRKFKHLVGNYGSEIGRAHV